MCSAIEVDGRIIVFNQDDARLPVRKRDGSLLWLPWGERYGRTSGWFAGPCARLDSIRAGKWQRFQPVPVKIAVERYMERDPRNRPFWARLAAGEFIQGLLATLDGEQRVYVVTDDTPMPFLHVSTRWPRIIAAPGAAPATDA